MEQMFDQAVAISQYKKQSEIKKKQEKMDKLNKKIAEIVANPKKIMLTKHVTRVCLCLKNVVHTQKQRIKSQTL